MNIKKLILLGTFVYAVFPYEISLKAGEYGKWGGYKGGWGESRGWQASDPKWQGQKRHRRYDKSRRGHGWYLKSPSPEKMKEFYQNLSPQQKATLEKIIEDQKPKEQIEGKPQKISLPAASPAAIGQKNRAEIWYTTKIQNVPALQDENNQACLKKALMDGAQQPGTKVEEILNGIIAQILQDAGEGELDEQDIAAIVAIRSLIESAQKKEITSSSQLNEYAAKINTQKNCEKGEEVEGQ